MSIATNQKLKELERRIEALEKAAEPQPPQVAIRIIPNAPSIPSTPEDDDIPMENTPPRGLIRRRTP